MLRMTIIQKGEPMSDLIDRQAAIDVLEERLKANGYSNAALVSELNRSIGYLMRLPSADAVEVVRCKDCKYQDKGENESESWNVCKYRPWLYFGIDDDDYCSNGERNDV